MRRGVVTFFMLAAGATLAAGSVQAQDYGGLKEGEGRTETFANCTNCHSAMLLRQQSHDRRTWSEIIDWMQETHGMWELEDETRDTILEYLTTHYGPDG